MSDIEKDIVEEKEFDNAEEMREEQIEDAFAECRELLERRHYSEFAQTIEEMNPVDAADFFSSLKYENIQGIQAGKEGLLSRHFCRA